MKIFVGNLSFNIKPLDVRNVFEAFGTVAMVDIKMKNKKAESRGFGFVEMPDENDGDETETSPLTEIIESGAETTETESDIPEQQGKE